MTPAVPRTFTPRKGLLSLTEALVRMAEKKTGISLWDGANGLGSVAEQKLKELNVPEEIQITGQQQGAIFTPRGLAEQAGFVKPQRKRKIGVKKAKPTKVSEALPPRFKVKA